MLKCNLCGNMFKVETKPGALFFTHPAKTTDDPWVRKLHICQDCEDVILEFVDNATRGDYDAWLKIKRGGRR